MQVDQPGSDQASVGEGNGEINSDQEEGDDLYFKEDESYWGGLINKSEKSSSSRKERNIKVRTLTLDSILGWVEN